MHRSRVLIRAPSNLGLRPPREGHEPGTWRAPEALTIAGLVEALGPSRVIDLSRPHYQAGAQHGTRLLNGHTIRSFSLTLADALASCLRSREFPIVVGGDCSILLGALAGARRQGPVSLVHIDGHSDFRHPGNYDSAAVLGAVGGMDLALATGHGEPLLTDWPEVSTPLVPERQVVQIGERESRNSDFPWPDVVDTAMTRIDVFAARQLGPAGILGLTTGVLGRNGWPFWIHFDVDVLDQVVMPAVDSPGSPGVDPDALRFILRRLLSESDCLGMTVAIFDPDLDPDGTYARFLVSLLRDAAVHSA